MTKISLTGIKAREAFVKGARYLASTVGQTLGPFGNNVYLEHGHKSTNDGFSISAELANTLPDEFERQGALVLHEVSSKTNEQVGDSTTTSEILAMAIIDETVKLLPSDTTLVAKKKSSEVLKMIEVSKDNVIEKLKEQIKPVVIESDLISAARVSVEDDELASLIGSTQYEIGKYGFILVEDSLETKSSVDIVKGIRIDNGFASTNFVTDQVKQTLDIDSINVILTNYTIDQKDIIALKDKIIMPLINAKKDKLAIIARAFTPDAIKLCNETVTKGFLLLALNAPYVYQTEVMKDLAAITGATYYDQEERHLDDLSIKDLGFATKILARRFDAIITGAENNPLTANSVQKRVEDLKKKISGAISDFEKKLIQARIAQFEGGFAILKIGSETSIDKQYKKDKAEDAVNSVRLAFQEGTVPGAGLAFKAISDELPNEDILKRPLLSINDQIMSSAPDGFVIEDWVRDPYLTLVAALTNACSVAGQFANIQGIVTTKDKKEKKDEEE